MRTFEKLARASAVVAMSVLANAAIAEPDLKGINNNAQREKDLILVQGTLGASASGFSGGGERVTIDSVDVCSGKVSGDINNNAHMKGKATVVALAKKVTMGSVVVGCP